MSTNVLWTPVRVIKTLTVPTVKVLIAVLVNKDSLEMVPFAKVFTYDRLKKNPAATEPSITFICSKLYFLYLSH